jgi:hypothetical protein
VRQELDVLVLACFEDTARQIGAPRHDQLELGRSYLQAVERLGFA